ncbi:hypothetical protein M427DRAFT_507160 [Gonapodya prolifera JEL478]|uniref:Allergen n=1 Tax=Gonapodya prolifera (strain JEL478) TaxID=1344416 RepID=A0A139A1Z8_GONPJ|nr:hypothetical protein M427DRAFT_507160 [Gonapodya prolifera JEL478]|eukprot:KXS10807.1 hypothetical protein M427DRAFT_507160 [Gonapodya prolifera JEL478]
MDTIKKMLHLPSKQEDKLDESTLSPADHAIGATAPHTRTAPSTTSDTSKRLPEKTGGLAAVRGTTVPTDEERLTSGRSTEDFTKTHRGVAPAHGEEVKHLHNPTLGEEVKHPHNPMHGEDIKHPHNLTHGDEVKQSHRVKMADAVAAETAEKEVEHRHRAPVTHETIRQVEREEVRPTIQKEIIQPQVQQIIQPIRDTRLEPERVEHIVEPTQVREIKGEARPEDEQRYRRQAEAVRDTRVESEVERQRVHHQPIVKETIHPHVVEEIQPVIEREVIMPKKVEVEVPIVEKVYEAPRVGAVRVAPTITATDLGLTPGNVTRRGVVESIERHLPHTEAKHQLQKDERQLRHETGQGVVGRAETAVAGAEAKHQLHKDDRQLRHETGQGVVGRAETAVAGAEAKHQLHKDDRQLRQETGQGVMGRAETAVAGAEAKHQLGKDERHFRREMGQGVVGRTEAAVAGAQARHEMGTEARHVPAVGQTGTGMQGYDRTREGLVGAPVGPTGTGMQGYDRTREGLVEAPGAFPAPDVTVEKHVQREKVLGEE